MGLTAKSTGAALLHETFRVKRKTEEDIVVALAGNPNVGKSTVFNALTGLRQHTGNWPGKTVATAQGQYVFQDTNHILVDLPGTYSLLANSVEEEIARNFLCFGEPDVTVVVVDATCLERNLNLVLQTMEVTARVVVCVNLMDEAAKKRITVDLEKLSALLHAPVVGTDARNGKGMAQLQTCIFQLARQSISAPLPRLHYPAPLEEAVQTCLPAVKIAVRERLPAEWVALKLLDANMLPEQAYLPDKEKRAACQTAVERARKTLQQQGIDAIRLRDMIVETLVERAEVVAHRTVFHPKNNAVLASGRMDRMVTSKRYGIPIMLALLSLILWLTVVGANAPSAFLSAVFAKLGDGLAMCLERCHAPAWLNGILVEGMYQTLAWVVAVMLPPMAIFFPLFTLLEDLGYLPRVAFNLDHCFQKANACGKQALTMCMGFGCNAAGVVGCRIIDSPRERLIAILTNNFVPCNGRFPILISLATGFFAVSSSGVIRTLSGALCLSLMIVFGVLMTLLVSRLLSETLLRGVPSAFALELPPYRRPQIGKVIVRSVFDRTLFVLGRAVLVSIPAGAVIWCMANISVDGDSLLRHCCAFLDPLGRGVGMDGVILMAFLLGFPANEIVVPIMLMAYTAGGHMVAYDGVESLTAILTANGWTPITALCTMLFSLLHFPCGTTCLTIRKETGSRLWTLAAVAIPTVMGLLVCFAVARLAALCAIG